jgi:hypothetical protein
MARSIFYCFFLPPLSPTKWDEQIRLTSVAWYPGCSSRLNPTHLPLPQVLLLLLAVHIMLWLLLLLLLLGCINSVSRPRRWYFVDMVVRSHGRVEYFSSLSPYCAYCGVVVFVDAVGGGLVGFSRSLGLNRYGEGLVCRTTTRDVAALYSG